MKKCFCLVLFLVFLHASPLFAVTGEIIVKSNNSTKLKVTVNTSSYAWKWDGTANKVIPETRAFPISNTAASVMYDSPTSRNSPSGVDYLPWGLMDFTISTLDAYGNVTSTINITLDLRDEDWSELTSKYPNHDTYINRDPASGKWYISRNDWSTLTGRETLLSNGALVHIWSFWSVESEPNTANLKIPITLMNRTEGGNFDFGYLVANGNEQIPSGQNGMFRYNIQNIVSHGTTEYNNSGLKNSFKWDPYNVTAASSGNIYNTSLNFAISENKSYKSITRIFKAVYPLTVKNDLEGLGTSAGSIYFKDPMAANILEEKSAAGAGFVKNEAFEALIVDLGTSELQKYALKAQSTIQYGGTEYRWYGGDFNPNASTNFTISGSTVKTARYKAHLQSSLQTATGSNGSQRKIARDASGKLHMVYESVDRVWYTTSTDGGAAWSFEQLISGSGIASSPCITASAGDVFFVWQETDGSTRKLYMKSLVNCPAPILLDSDAANSNLQPAISISSDAEMVLVVYMKILDGRYQMHYMYFNDYGTSFTSGGPVLFGSSYPYIWSNPSAAWNPSSGTFMVSATNSSSGRVSVELNSFDGSVWSSKGTVYYADQVPMAPVYSQTAVDGMGRTHISWIAYDDFYGNNSASMHRSYKDGIYSDISIFRDEAVYEPSIIYTTLSGHNDADGGVSLFYSPGDQIGIYNMVSTNGNYWDGMTYITPTSPIKFPTSVEKAPSAGVTYITSKGGSYPYRIATQTVNNTRAGGSYTLKAGSENQASSLGSGNHKLFRRIEVIDTTSGTPGRLTLQIGNFSGRNLSFKKPDSLKQKDNPFLSFLSTEAFTFEKNTSFSSDIWVKKTGWKAEVKLSLELVEEGSEKVLQKVYERILGSKDSIAEEKTMKIVNRLSEVKGYLRLRVDGVNSENLITNCMNLYLLNSGKDKGQKPGKEISESNLAPVEFSLKQNYPNPFNPSTAIDFQLPKASKVSLRVYDMLGKEVAALADGYKEMGSYSVQFNASHLPSGTYIYELRADGFVRSGKMMLLK
ncbi:MAG: T9SS type A sorting domain-containing protein [archaeon]